MKSGWHKVVLVLGCLPLVGYAAPSEPVTDPDAIAQHYRTVVLQPEYQAPEHVDFSDQLGNWLVHKLQDLTKSLAEFKYAGELGHLSFFLMLLILIVACMFLIYWGVRLWHNQRVLWAGDSLLPTGKPRYAKAETYEPAIAAAETARDWPRAFQARWGRFLSLLENSRYVVADRTQTNWEYWKQLHQQGAPTEAIQQTRELVQAFDRHIYGGLPLATAEWDRLRGQLQHCEQLLTSEIKKIAGAA